MEIRNLLTFVHVAELNSFTKAARALDYSQSTVSFQIKQLETELDCLLFERLNHTLLLTDRGRELLEYAQKVCQLTEEFHQHRLADRDVEGLIRFVSPDSICEVMLTDNYTDFYQHYPKIRLKFFTADTSDMFRILDRNEADVMMTLDGHVYQTDYIIAKEKQMSSHFVAGCNMPLANRKNISVHDLEDVPMILTEEGMGYRKLLDEAFARQSIEIHPVLEVGRTDVITSVLEDGHAVSYLPDFITRKKVEEGKLIYLDITDLQLDVWQQLIYHRNKWMSRPMELFLKYVSEHEFFR